MNHLKSHTFLEDNSNQKELNTAEFAEDKQERYTIRDSSVMEYHRQTQFDRDLVSVAKILDDEEGEEEDEEEDGDDIQVAYNPFEPPIYGLPDFGQDNKSIITEETHELNYISSVQSMKEELEVFPYLRDEDEGETHQQSTNQTDENINKAPSLDYKPSQWKVMTKEEE